MVMKMNLDFCALFIFVISPTLTAIVKRQACAADRILCASGMCLDRERLCGGAPQCAELKDEVLCAFYQNLQHSYVQFGNCILPAYPDNGRYVVAGATNAFPGQVLKNAQLTVTCNTGYNIEGDTTLECQKGAWSTKDFPKCIKMQLTESVAPWHASVYRKSTTQQQHTQACGGTLVSTTAVISVAQCFWNHRDKMVQKASRFAVAVGKVYHAWLHPDDIEVQISDVRSIKIPSGFKGVGSNLQDDIAIVLLTTAVIYTAYVKPVWLDYNAEFENTQLQVGKKGKIATWRPVDADKKNLLTLHLDQIPYAKNAQCAAVNNVRFTEYVSDDKFCAQYRDGTEFCRNDIGGGLVFSEKYGESESFYLRGVLSAAPSSTGICITNTVAVFTKISKHETFIKEFWSF